MKAARDKYHIKIYYKRQVYPKCDLQIILRGMGNDVNLK